jgi:HEAT repeat protein
VYVQMSNSDADTSNDSVATLRDVVSAGHLGSPEVPLRHLEHHDPLVRAAALAALDRLGAATSAAVTAGLTDPDRCVRRRATAIAAGRRDLTDALLTALADEDPMVTEAAAFALGEIDLDRDADGWPGAPAGVVEALGETATGHDDPLCRESAVAALGSLGDPAGRDAVLTACSDRAAVRRRAVLALAAFDGPEVTAMLENLLEDRDLQVRQAAEDLLAIESGSPT